MNWQKTDQITLKTPYIDISHGVNFTYSNLVLIYFPSDQFEKLRLGRLRIYENGVKLWRCDHADYNIKDTFFCQIDFPI